MIMPGFTHEQEQAIEEKMGLFEPVVDMSITMEERLRRVGSIEAANYTKKTRMV